MFNIADRWNRILSPEPGEGSRSSSAGYRELSSPTINIASHHDKETSPSRFRDWVSSGGSKFKPGKFMEKLKRHLSSEKLHRVAEEDHYDAASQFVNGRIPPRSSAYGRVDPTNYTSQVKSARKKRSILDMARRKTTEISPLNLRPRNSLTENDPTSTSMNTSAASSSSSSRTTPLDRLKTFFRLSKENLSSAGDTSSKISNVAPSALGGSSTSSGYSGGYTSTSSSSKNWSPRKQYYHNRPVSTPMAGYSPGRYWYEDHSLY